MKISRCHTLLSVICVLAAIFLSIPRPAYPEEDRSVFYPASVMDISDDKYEPAITKLLDEAKTSIVISMNMTEVKEDSSIRWIMARLESALKRGVAVDIYKNDMMPEGQAPDAEIEKDYGILKEKGCRIFNLSLDGALSNRSIIVDGRYFILGDANWIRESLKDTLVCATFLDSPEFARNRLDLLERLAVRSQNN